MALSLIKALISNILTLLYSDVKKFVKQKLKPEVA